MFAVLFGVQFFAIVALLFLAKTNRNIFVRVLAVNVLGTVIAILVATIGVFENEPDYFDIALLYILFNFSMTLALLRFFKGRHIPRALLKDMSRVPLTHEDADDGRDASERTC